MDLCEGGGNGENERLDVITTARTVRVLCVSASYLSGI